MGAGDGRGRRPRQCRRSGRQAPRRQRHRGRGFRRAGRGGQAAWGRCRRQLPDPGFDRRNSPDHQWRRGDVVLENVGDPELFPKAFATLAFGGRLVTAGGHAGGAVLLDVKHLYLNRITIIGDPLDTPESYELEPKLAAQGRLKVLMTRCFHCRRRHRRTISSKRGPALARYCSIRRGASDVPVSSKTLKVRSNGSRRAACCRYGSASLWPFSPAQLMRVRHRLSWRCCSRGLGNLSALRLLPPWSFV